MDKSKKDLKTERDLWEQSSRTLMDFIRTHIAIVGFKEIEGFKKCKEAFAEAEQYNTNK